MIFIITLGGAAFQKELRFNEYYGLSTDEKPVNDNNINIPNGSTLYCMDNQVTFMFDAENNEWRQQ